MSDKNLVGKAEGLINWAKQNTMIAGIFITVVPSVLTFGYYAITELNKAIEIRDNFTQVAEDAALAKRKVLVLEEKLSEQREVIAKLQDRTSDATINSREAKVVAESTQKELRSGMAAQKVELDVTSSTLRSEMNTLKRATTNRLGN
jgi:hypothetical protein